MNEGTDTDGISRDEYFIIFLIAGVAGAIGRAIGGTIVGVVLLFGVVIVGIVIFFFISERRRRRRRGHHRRR